MVLILTGSTVGLEIPFVRGYPLSDNWADKSPVVHVSTKDSLSHMCLPRVLKLKLTFRILNC
jgi:hypothetical protein